MIEILATLAAHVSAPPEDPSQDNDQPAALTLKLELKDILDRYNYKSDRSTLLKAVIMVCT